MRSERRKLEKGVNKVSDKGIAKDKQCTVGKRGNWTYMQ